MKIGGAHLDQLHGDVVNLYRHRPRSNIMHWIQIPDAPGLPVLMYNNNITLGWENFSPHEVTALNMQALRDVASS